MVSKLVDKHFGTIDFVGFSHTYEGRFINSANTWIKTQCAVLLTISRPIQCWPYHKLVQCLLVCMTDFCWICKETLFRVFCVIQASRGTKEADGWLSIRHTNQCHIMSFTCLCFIYHIATNRLRQPVNYLWGNWLMFFLFVCRSAKWFFL